MLDRTLLPPQVTITHCGKACKGVIPREYRTGFGPGLTALISEMAGTQADSRSIIQNFCPSVPGFSISLGTIQKVLDRVSQSLETSCKMISGQVRKEKINPIDETSWHKNGIVMWMRVMATKTSAFFMIHSHRFRAAFDSVALFEDFKTFILFPHAHVK